MKNKKHNSVKNNFIKKAIKQKNNSSNKMWGGRFSSLPSEIMQQINQSISFDQKLYRQDIAASIAHAKMMAKVGIISQKEFNQISQGLAEIKAEIENNKFDFKIELEDIHMNIEAALKEKIGEVAGKLHTARSRNDQVAVDFKMFVRDQIDEISALIYQLQKNIVKKAEENISVIMPGFTHLQVAQPVLFSHHLLAYFEMFKRDISRLSDLRKRINECPLGACALAGTSFNIDREYVARELNFDSATANSMDSVSDRDFAAEFLFCLSLISVHLSRISEEIIIWMSKGFDFIKLSDAFTSGSSIMPQKKNPDAAELIRGKTGRIFGSLISLLTILKGLPLTYSKDMQEDKEPVFDASINAKLCISAISAMIDDLEVNAENMYQMSKKGYSTATDLADWLVKNLKLPFRESHHITGSIVKMAEAKNLELHQLKISEMQKICPLISDKIYQVLSVENSVNTRVSYGGTATSEVKKQIKNAKNFLAKSVK
jgi:argininosuccinate lyase